MQRHWVLLAWLWLVAGFALAAESQRPAQQDQTATRVVFLATHAIAPEVTWRMFEAFRDRVARSRGVPSDLSFEYHRLPGSTGSAEREAVALLRGGSVRLVMTTSMPAAWALQKAAPNLPIVFSGGGHPVTMCMVDSMERPGRNVTGRTSFIPVGEKLVEALVDGFPSTRTVVVLVDGVRGSSTNYCPPSDASPGTPVQWPRCRPGFVDDAAEVDTIYSTEPFVSAGSRSKRSTRFYRLCEASDFAGMARAVRALDGAGLVIPIQVLFQKEDQALVEEVNGMRIPAVFGRSEFVEKGALMAVTVRPEAQPLRAATDLAIQVLRGIHPSVLPIRTPDSVDLWINIDTASQTGLRPSLRTLQRADRLLRSPLPRQRTG